MSKGTTVKDVPAAQFIKAYAEHLKKNNWLELPAWVDIVKTGYFKELCPQDPDWYYVRAASIARKIYLKGGNGVGGLTKIYGGAHRRGCRPNKFATSSGKVARYIVQQLTNIGVVELHTDKSSGQVKGRQISTDGRRDLDRIAARVAAASK
uniref:40S ribosomal protein S19 n=1 Tax=Arcella intermedia TaxID=1963864 RepID=A0A6B2LNN4_9EUKA|eukprot:TRINITY_DN783_c0_g1_i1.p1 TRINITY_DN783_c0_g1~~TRINITY_DN783_c0_g1_i1.p1  ORF type:complete len:151 (-),score=23.95 TRINITY_DN783_c0_g1_i1:112-564(-)